MVDNEPPRTTRRSADRPVMGDHPELEEEDVTVTEVMEGPNPMSRFLVPAIAAVVVIVLVILLISIL